MRQNLVFAFVYNALGVPIAAGVLYPLTGLAAVAHDRGAGDEPQFGVGDRQRAAIAAHALPRGLSEAAAVDIIAHTLSAGVAIAV